MNIKEIAIPVDYLDEYLPKIRGTDLKMLIILHRYADRDGYLRKSARWYGMKTGVHHHTAIGSLKTLAELGYIEIYTEHKFALRLVRRVFNVNTCICTSINKGKVPSSADLEAFLGYRI